MLHRRMSPQNRNEAGREKGKNAYDLDDQLKDYLDVGASTKIGEFTASGFLFKDSVEIVTVEDPEGGQHPLSHYDMFRATQVHV